MSIEVTPVRFSEINRPVYFWARLTHPAVSIRAVSSNDLAAMMELKDRLEEDPDTQYAKLFAIIDVPAWEPVYILHIHTATRAEGWSVEDVVKEWKAVHYGLPIIRDRKEEEQ